MIESVSQERWQQAQTAELATVLYDDPEKSRRAVATVFDYLGMSFHQSGRSIVEVGCGAFPASRFCAGIWATLYEPLRFDELVHLTTARPGFNWHALALEDAEDLPSVDECWLFNCLQHVRDPDEVVARCKRMAPVIRFFEPIDYPTSEYHPHTFTIEDFKRWFGTAERYKGGSVEGFHESDCAYGTWHV